MGRLSQHDISCLHPTSPTKTTWRHYVAEEPSHYFRLKAPWFSGKMPAQKPSNWNPTPQLWREIRLFLSQLPFQKKKVPSFSFCSKSWSCFLLLIAIRNQKKAAGQRLKSGRWGELLWSFCFSKKNCGKYSHVELGNVGKVSMIFLSWCWGSIFVIKFRGLTFHDIMTGWSQQEPFFECAAFIWPYKSGLWDSPYITDQGNIIF